MNKYQSQLSFRRDLVSATLTARLICWDTMNLAGKSRKVISYGFTSCWASHRNRFHQVFRALSSGKSTFIGQAVHWHEIPHAAQSLSPTATDFSHTIPRQKKAMETLTKSVKLSQRPTLIHKSGSTQYVYYNLCAKFCSSFFLISCLNLLLLRWGRTRVVQAQTFRPWLVIKMGNFAHAGRYLT